MEQFLPLPLANQSRLGQIEIALNPPQSVVVDDALIAQTNDGLSFDIESDLLEPLKLRSGDFTPAFFWIFCAKLQLLDALVIFRPQTLEDIHGKFSLRGKLLDQRDGSLVRFHAGRSLLFVGCSVASNLEFSNYDRQSKTLKDQGGKNDAEGKEQNVVPAGECEGQGQSRRQ